MGKVAVKQRGSFMEANGLTNEPVTGFTLDV